jgi:PAS domain S-box-containing protein
MGVVAKIDMSEVRAPYLTAGLILLGLSLMIITIGGLIFYWLSRPLLDRISEHQRLGRILASSINEIYVFDTSWFKFSWVNEGSRYNLGYSSDELSEMTPWDLMPDVSDAEFKSMVGSLIGGEESLPAFETHHQRKDGSLYPVEIRLQLFHHEEPPVFVAVVLDITERRQSEKVQSNLGAQLEAKNKELEQIIYAASHDLRSPLINIEGYSRELEHEVEKLRQVFDNELRTAEGYHPATAVLTHDIPDSLRIIRASAAKMDSLVLGLLKLSRSGRASLAIESLDMNELISTVIEACDFQIKQAKVEIEFAALPPCKGDAIQVNQVFSNLIGNALQYLGQNRPRLIRISGEVEAERCVYCVEDNGIGIAPAHQQNIFEIFHRLDPENGEGEGLGLTIVQQIVGRLAGEVWVESELGQGSQFYVTLPVN